MSKADTIDDPAQALLRLDHFEQRLHELQQELEHAQRLATIGTLASGVAHEVNNLLTPALAYAQLARASREDLDLLRKAADKSAEGIEAACRILQAILDFSRPPSACERADVNTVLDAAIECLGRDPGRDNIRIVREVPAGTAVLMEELSLQQVLLNLLLNACKALRSQRGGTIHVQATAACSGRIRLSIADDGPGLAPEIADRIFEPFVTAPAGGPVPEGQAGSGLGLAICRRAMEAAGGSIAAVSQPGAGAKFELTLLSPLHQTN
jgi:signal transduction histidine kinase